MPELDFQIVEVEAASRGLTPLLHFKLKVTTPATEPIQALILNAQIQIQSPQRSYTDAEKKRLVELFGTPERWGQTLQNRLWAHANTTTGSFTRETETILPVPCSYDLNLASAKFFYALDSGDVPLLFLFSGSVFYSTPEGRLQVERVSWNKECTCALPVRTWKDLMEQHYPNSGWLYLQRETFDRLCEFKRRHGLPTWERAMDQMLASIDAAQTQEVLA